MDGFLVNLLLFVAGQVAAWHYLRTGRLLVGFGATLLLWGLLDAWLVARYAYRLDGPPWSWLVVGFQATAVATLGMLGFGLWRRRWSPTAKARSRWFGTGIEQYLRGDLAAAIGTFRRLLRTDPWDAAAWLALGNVLRCQGRLRQARGCYRNALRVDREGVYRDHARLQLARADDPARRHPAAG